MEVSFLSGQEAAWKLKNRRTSISDPQQFYRKTSNEHLRRLLEHWP